MYMHWIYKKTREREKWKEMERGDNARNYAINLF